MYDEDDPWRGAELARLRRARSMTQADVARDTLNGLSTVKRAERGEALKAETLRSLCDLFGVTPEQVGAAADAARAADAPRDGGPVADEGVRVLPDPGSEPPDVVAIPASPLPAVGGALSPRAPRTPSSVASAVDGWVAPLMRSAFAFAFAALAVAEAASWTPVVRDVFTFCAIQALTLWVTTVTLIWTFALRPPKPGETADGRRSRKAMGFAALAAGFLLTSVTGDLALGHIKAERAYVGEALLAYGDAVASVRRSRLADPSYDDGMDRWWLERLKATALGQGADWLDSPGAYKARLAVEAACAAEWRDAPTLDHARCDRPPEVPTFDRRATALRLFGLADGDLSDHSLLARFRAHFAEPRPGRGVADARPVPGRASQGSLRP